MLDLPLLSPDLDRVLNPATNQETNHNILHTDKCIDFIAGEIFTW